MIKNFVRMHLGKKDLLELDKIKRLNIINALTGIKSVNLIGSVSNDKQTNLAIFSSVVHLGSNPALLGFVSRPSSEVRRHTLENIIESGTYTINHVNESIIKQSHYTSAKFEKNQSEFEQCGLTEEYYGDFKSPFVKECNVKIGMNFIEQIPIKSNNTILVVGEIKHILLPDSAINNLGHINLSELRTVGISGLNNYYKIDKICTLPYARVQELPEFSN